MTFLHFALILLGLAGVEHVFNYVREMLAGNQPVAVPVSPLRGAIESFERHQLEVEGKVSAPAPKELKHEPQPAGSSVAQSNYDRWAENKAKAPFVQDGIEILESLSDLSKCDLDIESQHNVEVLSNQTVDLLENYMSTPQAIRTMPAVEEALLDQIRQIEESVTLIQADGADRMVRDLKVGTGFLRTKFQPKD